MRVAFLGLGIMGSRMAANLVKANDTVSVWNRTPGKDLDLVQAGAERAASPAACAEGAEVVVSMLSTPEVDCAVVGMRTVKEVQANVALAEDESRRLDLSALHYRFA